MNLASCNLKTGKEKDKTNSEELSNDVSEDPDCDIETSATNYCDCMNDTYNDVDPY